MNGTDDSATLRAAAQERTSLLGIAGLPSTATSSTSAALLGVMLGGAGLLLLLRRRRAPASVTS